MKTKLIPDGYKAEDIISSQAIFDRIDVLARRANMSLSDVAKSIGMSSANRFFVIKSRNSIPSLEMLCKLADLFDTTLDYLIAGRIPFDRDELSVLEDTVLSKIRTSSNFKIKVKELLQES